MSGYQGVHAYAGSTTTARPAFGNFSKNLSGSERINIMATNIIYCNCENKNRPIRSQSEKLAFRKLQNETCPEYCDRLPFNKTSLQVNLITSLDMSGAVLISSVSDPSVPSGIYPGSLPYYDFYYFDPYGVLLPKTECGINKFVNYMIINKFPFKSYPHDQVDPYDPPTIP